MPAAKPTETTDLHDLPATTLENTVMQQQRTTKPAHDYDVAILGSGIGGSILAAILARNGVKVVLVEKNEHPRFAIGESTTPESTALLGIVAQRYGVPEIANLANFAAVRRHVSSSCGVKRNFTFAYHRPGESQRGEECTQFPTWAPPFGPDVHFFRQDTDAYVYGLAARYGATTRARTQIDAVELDDEGVDLTTAKGERIRARFVVDAAGFGSVLARQLDLREGPGTMLTNSRTIFTHMIDVEAYDRCGPDRREHGMPSPFHQGTLHHIFDGGWMWVIPFDNHPGSTNALCSVGLCLDNARFPRDPELSAAEEFELIIARYPSIARQFRNARPVRDWIATGRMQYRCSRIAGDRFLLLPHSAGFVDPLFSSGLALTMSAINILGDQLIEATREDDFRADRFEVIEDAFWRNFDYYDRLAAHSYTSFASFPLWNAWHRTWTLGSLYGVSGMHEVFSRALEDRAAYRGFEEAPYRGVQAIDLPSYVELFDDVCELMARFGEGEADADQTRAAIFARLERSPLCPEPWKVTDEARRYPATFTLVPMVRLLRWARKHGPEDVRKHYFHSGRADGWFSAMWETHAAERGRAAAALELWKSSVFSWNEDWKQRQKGKSIWA